MENTLDVFEKDELFALAQHDYENERLEQALAKLKRLLDGGEFPVNVFSLLGRIYAALGLDQRAKVALEAYVEQVPEVVPEHFHLGLVMRNLGDTEQAVKIWDDVLEKAPAFPPALYNKALFLLEQNQEQEAIELLNKIIETANDADEHVTLANDILSRLSMRH